jgi:hypothetical protein
MFNDICCPDIELDTSLRLGKIVQSVADSASTTGARPKTRPIRVVLRNEADKAMIIKNAPKIRQSK